MNARTSKRAIPAFHLLSNFLSRNTVLLVLIGAIVFSGISMVVYCEEAAFSFKFGVYSPEEASRLGIPTQHFCGWPRPVYIQLPNGLLDGYQFITQSQNLREFFWAILIETVILSYLFIPNLVFWATVSFVLIVFMKRLVFYRRR